MSDQAMKNQSLDAVTPSTMAHSTAGYTPFTDIGGASPVEAEILAFGLCNTRLAKARDAKSRIDAIYKNQQLWSMLVRDLASDGNQLPVNLKQELIELGFWSMRYGNQASGSDLPLEPLIAVNRNILEGLRSQRGGAAAVAAKSPSQPAGAQPPSFSGLNASA